MINKIPEFGKKYKNKNDPEFLHEISRLFLYIENIFVYWNCIGKDGKIHNKYRFVGSISEFWDLYEELSETKIECYIDKLKEKAQKLVDALEKVTDREFLAEKEAKNETDFIDFIHSNERLLVRMESLEKRIKKLEEKQC